MGTKQGTPPRLAVNQDKNATGQPLPQEGLPPPNATRSKRIRAAARLSDTACRKTKGPAILEDGRGLRLIIDERGNRRWVLRFTIDGKRVNRGLGSYPDVSLVLARRRMIALRQAAAEGRDARIKPRLKAKPGPRPPSAPPEVMTFRNAFTLYFETTKRPTLTHGRFAERWPQSMEQYVYPSLGDRPVADITGVREIKDNLRLGLRHFSAVA